MQNNLKQTEDSTYRMDCKEIVWSAMADTFDEQIFDT